MDNSPGPEPTPRRRPAPLLVALLAVLVLLAATLAWLSRPPQVAALVLQQAGDALGLEIRFDGAAEYRLRGVPHLMVRDLEVHRPGAAVPLLSAHRAYLALPWSTLRARGRELTVERIEFDAPVLDLQELQAWLETRPPAGAPRVPTLTQGLRITRGTVAGGDWTLRRVGVDIPFLAPAQPVRGHAVGELRTGDSRLPFNVHATLASPARDAAIGVAGNVTLASDSWTLPMQAVLQGRLHAGEDGLGLDGMQLGIRARYLAPDREALRFTAGLAAPARYLDGRLQVTPAALVLRGDGTVPDLEARGGFTWQGDDARLELEGSIREWPPGWPALPSPLSDATTPLPFALAYTGPFDLSGPANLHLERNRTRLDARFHLPEVLDWLERRSTDTPLPPLQGRLSTPRLELPGATLHGVEIEMSAESAEPTGP